MQTYALVYQAGIANVFRLEDGHYRRVLQHAFKTCEWFCVGAKSAGATIKVYACNRAGDIADQPWDTDLDNAPWHEQFARYLDR